MAGALRVVRRRIRSRQVVGWVLFAFACLTASPPASHAQSRIVDAARGRSLYENRCLSCHATGVHARGKRIARDFEQAREQVRRWSTNIRAGWKTDEIDDVTVYLTRRFYRYPCPPSVCPARMSETAPTRG